jgi:lipopolysaccharide transport system permease protein
MSTVVERPAVAERPTAAPPLRGHELPIKTIEPWRPGVQARFEEVWRYRRMLSYLGKQFVLRRYRKTYLGWLWIPMKPGIDILSKTLFFGGLLQVSSGDRPYFIFVAFASAGWTLFERCLYWGARAGQMAQTFARGRHFPRTPVLIASITPSLIDYVLYTAVAIGGVFYYLFKGHFYLAPPQHWIFAIFGFILLIVFGQSVGMILSPLTEITKEVRYVLQYVMQLWYFVTPIVYPISSLPPKYQIIAEVNPLTAPLELMKYGLLATAPPKAISLLSAVIAIPLFVLAGLAFSSRMERKMVARL